MATRYYYFQAESFELTAVQARMPTAAALVAVAPQVTQPSFLVVQIDDTAPNEDDLFAVMASFGFTYVASTLVAPVFTQVRHFGGRTAAPTVPAPAVGDEFFNATYVRPEEFDGTLWNPVARMYRPSLDDQTIPATLYVDNVTGSDSNDGLTALTAWATLKRAFQYIASNPRTARTINVAASGVNYAWPALATSAFSYVTILGALTTVEAAQAITSVGASSRANGLTMTVAGAPWAVDQHRGRLVRWTSGTLNNQYGVVYSNTANTISVSQDTRGTFKIPAVGNSFEILEQGATIDFPDGAAPVMESSVQLNIRQVKLSGANRQLFVNNTDRIEFQRCRMDLLNFTTGRGGSADVRTCYLRNAGTSGFQNGMVSSNTDGCLELSDGTVIDGAGAAVAGNRHVIGQADGAFRFIGEVVFSQLGTQGLLLRSSDVVTRRTSLVTDSELRFVNTCTAGVVVDGGSEGVGGALDLPDLFGTVANNFGLVAFGGAIVRIGSSSSLVSATGTNKWSADGAANIRTAADGTLIMGPGFPFTGYGLDIVQIPFTFATASPLAITPQRATDFVMRADVSVDTTFNGVAPALRLGTAASPGGILDSTIGEIDPTVADTYRTFDRFEVGATTNLQLTITPGAGATQGAGRVFLWIWRA